jgi:hypothetical protein
MDNQNALSNDNITINEGVQKESVPATKEKSAHNQHVSFSDRAELSERYGT